MCIRIDFFCIACAGAFSVGVPEKFVGNYRAAQLFLGRLEALCGDRRALEAFRGSTAHAAFQDRWMAIKAGNKMRLAEYIRDHCKLIVNTEALFDVQVKRIHEYKRQFMNILSVIHRYLWIKALPVAEHSAVVPRVVIFGGKAAPGYFMAKAVIKLINSVAEVVNADPQTNNLLQVNHYRAHSLIRSLRWCTFPTTTCPMLRLSSRRATFRSTSRRPAQRPRARAT